MQWYNIVCVCSIVACRAVIQVELTEWFAFFACPVDEFSVKLMPPGSETESCGMVDEWYFKSTFIMCFE